MNDDTTTAAAGSPVERPVGRPVEVCGILHGGDTIGPTDADGCLLENGHAGPHEFADQSGRLWLWETDMECDCAHCMQCEGDYCTIYWRKPPNARANARP